MINDCISIITETDCSPNYTYISKHKRLIDEIKKLKAEGAKIVYYPYFVMINGKTYNVVPEQVRKL